MKSILIKPIQSTQTKSNFLESFSIRKISELQAGKDTIQGVHRHDFFYMLAIKKGEGSHSIDFHEYGVKKNSLYFMRPGQVHSHILKSGSEGFLIAFKSGFYPYTEDQEEKKRFIEISKNNYYVFSNNDFDFLISILNYIHFELESKSEQFENVIRSYLNIFFVLMTRTQKSQKKIDVSYSSVRFGELQELIEKHFSETKKVVDYAKKMNLSNYQLNTITKKMVGKNCSDVISDYVVLEAKRLLLSTSSQINEISFLLGFEDPAYFNRFFKKYNGVTPKSFRDDFREYKND